MSRVWVVVGLVALCHCRAATDNANANANNTTEAFVPTHEWQQVKKGQAIPEGLHVRMNFETKIVEAKLLESKEERDKDKEKEEDKTSSLTVVREEAEPEEKSEGGSDFFTINDSLEDALKKLPRELPEASQDKRFRTLDEIESEFGDLKMKVKTDAEIMNDLFRRYRSLSRQYPSSRTNKENLDADIGDSPVSVDMLDVFVDLEYLVHQYDNAQEFVRMKGLETIIYPNLNGTENTLKSEALKVLAACLQNNIKVQVYALETNAGELLLKILSLDNNEYVKTRATRALGCLLRGFPTAQKQLISKHGLDVLQNILLSNNPSFFKLKFLILTLLEDLVIEHKLIINFQGLKVENEEKIRIYREVDLMSKLSNPVFCGIVSKLLQEYFDSQHSFTRLEDLEHIHQIIATMMTFADACKQHHYKDKKILTTFHKIQTVFKKSMTSHRDSSSESSSEIHEFYARILEVIENYIDVLHDSKFKDEL